jgi:hypothetical protein
MELEMNHEEKHGMLSKLNHMNEHHHPWQSNWKSPVGLGIFLLTASLSLAIFLYTVLNLVGAVLQATHPASQGISAQQMQQLQQLQSQSAGPGAAQ